MQNIPSVLNKLCFWLNSPFISYTYNEDVTHYSIININSWFISNLLSFNIDKTHFLQFLTKNSKLTNLSISYQNKRIIKVKFRHLKTDNYLSWNFRIEEIIPILYKACFAIRSVRPYLSYEVVRMIYYSYFHSVMSYSIIFGGNSPQNNSIFKMIKKKVLLWIQALEPLVVNYLQNYRFCPFILCIFIPY